jgi:hypothetical protein
MRSPRSTRGVPPVGCFESPSSIPHITRRVL